MKVVINTVGTSVLPYEFLSRINREVTSENREVEIKKLLNEAKELLREKVQEVQGDLSRISAEINCLERIGINRDDVLYFLTTHTPDGSICGEVVADFCRKEFSAKCHVIEVDGLQVTDAGEFANKGLNNFVDEIIKIYNRFLGYDIAFNTTGGFKAVVPYTTLMGLVFGIPTYYIFERSNQLIKLPAAPVQFNMEVLKKLDSVIGIIYEDYMDLWDFLKKTGFSEESWWEELAGAVAEEEGMVTLSPLGRLLYKRYLLARGYDIQQSSEVKRKLSSGKFTRETFERYFSRMRDPIHLRSKLHNEVQGKNVDCDCYKPGNVNERIFYYVEDKVVKICDIFNHDRYDREVNKGSVLKMNYTFDV